MSLPTIFDYLPSEDALAIVKLAKEENTSVIKPVLLGLGTLGGGIATGYGLGRLANKVYEKTQGRPIPPQLLGAAGGLIGAGFSLAYARYKAEEREEMRRAIEAKRNRAQRSVPGK